ncbi:MAG TPA: DUF4189 domain-containing protein [Stellaceae bacterium]|nr:DUF4189 domain-containing protein [Stellaceae bacterium]
MKLNFPMLFLLGALVGLIATPAAVRADCFEDCRNNCRNAASSGVTSDQCLSTCNQQRCAPQANFFGAIAYSEQNGAWGDALDLPDGDSANNGAIAKCRAHALDCKVVLSFENTCGALAAANNKRYGTGQAPDRQKAESLALAACRTNGGVACNTLIGSCTRHPS